MLIVVFGQLAINVIKLCGTDEFISSMVVFTFLPVSRNEAHLMCTLLCEDK